MPTTNLVFKQNNTSPGDALISGCPSGMAESSTATKKLAFDGGSSGATQYSVTIEGSDTGAASLQVGMQWNAITVGRTTWDAGDWIVRLNVSDGNPNVSWQEAHICRVNTSNVVQETIASVTGLNILMSLASTKTVTMTTVGSATALSTDKILWTLVFQKSTSATATFKYKSNKNLASPIIKAREEPVPVAGVAGASLSPILGLTPGVAASSFGAAAATSSPGVLSKPVGVAGVVTGLGAVVSTPGPISVSMGVAGIDALAVPPSKLEAPGGAPPASRIISAGTEAGADISSVVTAARLSTSFVGAGAYSSSMSAASQFSWSGQRLGSAPYGALLAGRTISSTQRLLAIVGADPVSSRHSQSGAVQGVGGSCGVAAAAISSCGVEIGGLAYAD